MVCVLTPYQAYFLHQQTQKSCADKSCLFTKLLNTTTLFYSLMHILFFLFFLVLFIIHLKIASFVLVSLITVLLK